MGNCWPKKLKAAFSGNDVMKYSPLPSAESPDLQKQITRSRYSTLEGGIKSSPRLKEFTFHQLINATRNFCDDNILGGGGFGNVYRGWIDKKIANDARFRPGMHVAVKKLRSDGFQGQKEWEAEINYLGQLNHVNLCKLIGYCSDGENRLLVYEYLPEGSLEDHLFKRGSEPLPWELRIKIAVGAARGICYLHDYVKPIIHRDFKSSNVLLDSDFNAKISDFGLAKDGPTGDSSHVTTRVLGTQGYADPVYVQTGRLTAKSDVYSFGVVLLELITGRPALDIAKHEELVIWSKPYLDDLRKLPRIMDTNLGAKYPKEGAKMVALVAKLCIGEAKIRPPMSDVLLALENRPDLITYGGSPSLLESEQQIQIQSKLCNRWSFDEHLHSPRLRETKSRKRSPHQKV